jgi:peroxiredoxin
MDFDASGLLGNVRSKRFVAIVEDGVVKKVFVEDEAPNITVTAAEKVLEQL